MANTTHACFRQPDSNDIKLWRYMDFTKFMGMLCSKGLYFCRADCFEDPFEGTFSKANHTPESVTIPPAPSTAPINIPRCLPTAPPIDANDAQSQ